MSKKTNAAKREKPTKHMKPRLRAEKRRKNPITQKDIEQLGKPPGIFGDPIFLYHVASAILRYVEIAHPVEFGISNMLNSRTPPMVDAEFATLPPLTCSACGITSAEAHERSMGLYCEKTTDGIHYFTPSGTDSRKVPESQTEPEGAE